MASTNSPLHRLFGIDVSAHGNLEGYKFDPDANLEVISLGISRTGTTSCHAALTKLGHAPGHQGVDLFRSPQRNEAFIDLFSKVVNGVWEAGDPVLSTRLRDLMRGYRSSTDLPVCNLGPEVYAAYPNAKYILTVRRGAKKDWWRSMSATWWHFRRDGARYLFRFLIYSVTFLRRTDDLVQVMLQLWLKRFDTLDADLYDKHNELVKKTIPADQLLVFDVQDGWEPLCKFLGKEVPREPFPNLNDSKAMHAIYFGMMAYGAFWWAVYVGSVMGMAYLFQNPAVVKILLQQASALGLQMMGRVGLR